MTSGSFLAALLLSLSPAAAMAQSPPAESVDDLFARARNLAFSGKRAEALALCHAALERSPAYHDIRILAGRIHAWEGRHEEGRAELRRVLQADPGHVDGRIALVDLELWSDHPETARALCDEGLALHPGNADLLLRKARALKALGRYPEALAEAKQALALAPQRYEIRTLIENLAELSRRSKLSLSATYDRFDRTFDPWRMTSFSASHRFDAGSLIARINRAERFGSTGHQVEVDAYPRWKDGTYFYLNAGFSGAGIFPRRRYGAEIYHNFPKGFEGSLGLRHLRFAASNVTIYTGTLGKYWGDYFFSFRANATPSSIGSSRSGAISARRYFGDGENHATLSLGSGVSPDQANPDVEILNLRSRKASLAAQGWIHRRLILSGSLAYEKQEIAAGIDRSQTTFGLGIEWRF